VASRAKLATVFPKSLSKPELLASDFDSFKRQESIFIILNLFILATLLLVHVLFASHWGFPSASLIAILAGAVVVQGAELFWLLAWVRPLVPREIEILSWSAIFLNIVLALALAEISNREDTQYFVLMVVPILVASFRLGLVPTLAVIGAVDFINFYWVWSYGQKHPHPLVGEYFEAGTISLIYAVVGVLGWLLVDHLYQAEARLAGSLRELERTRERLLREEKLAAVGRFASAIAHEIRNPVSSIVSALVTARGNKLAPEEREEMFEIASKESRRLERMTTDFLSYARPRQLQRTYASLDDTLGYVADSCRPYALERGVTIQAHTSNNLATEMDSGYIQQALVDLVMNAVDAASREGRVELRAAVNGDGSVRMEVENSGQNIPAENLLRIFEPFFTTKSHGTGLGLAIAHSIAHAHGGDLTLTANEPGRVCFTLTIPAAAKPEPV
jgi:two-component system, NtrC family, sensor histidine kinase HydH